MSSYEHEPVPIVPQVASALLCDGLNYTLRNASHRSTGLIRGEYIDASGLVNGAEIQDPYKLSPWKRDWPYVVIQHTFDYAKKRRFLIEDRYPSFDLPTENYYDFKDTGKLQNLYRLRNKSFEIYMGDNPQDELYSTGGCNDWKEMETEEISHLTFRLSNPNLVLRTSAIQERAQKTVYTAKRLAYLAVDEAARQSLSPFRALSKITKI